MRKLRRLMIFLGLVCITFILVLPLLMGWYQHTFEYMEIVIVRKHATASIHYKDTIKNIRRVAQLSKNDDRQIEEGFVVAIQSTGTKEQQYYTLFQLIELRNPSAPVNVYNNIDQIVQDGKQKYVNDIHELSDAENTYIRSFTSFPGNIFASWLGFPRIDLSKYSIHY